MKKPKLVKVVALPDIEKKIMNRSYVRSGVVRGGTLLNAGARRATVSMPERTGTDEE